MKPLQNMKLVIPEIIQEKCNEFVENFSIEILDELPQKLSHNKTWKEPEEVLVEITEEILNTLIMYGGTQLFVLNSKTHKVKKPT